MPTAYASVIEAMLGGWVHVGVHGPASYVIATEREPLLEHHQTEQELVIVGHTLSMIREKTLHRGKV